ncbi:hypothetical protein EC991_000310, partial [Linnemannia zychae]
IEIVPVSLSTLTEVSDALAKEMKAYNERGQELVVFQLCDGTASYLFEPNSRSHLNLAISCLYFTSHTTMPTSVPLAAVRILRPLQGRRPLSHNNLAELASGDGDQQQAHEHALESDPMDPITL